MAELLDKDKHVLPGTEDKRQPVVVAISEFKGVQRLDIRHYYKDAAAELQPTQKGVSIEVEYMDSLIELLLALRDNVVK